MGFPYILNLCINDHSPYILYSLVGRQYQINYFILWRLKKWTLMMRTVLIILTLFFLHFLQYSFRSHSLPFYSNLVLLHTRTKYCHLLLITRAMGYFVIASTFLHSLMVYALVCQSLGFQVVDSSKRVNCSYYSQIMFEWIFHHLTDMWVQNGEKEIVSLNTHIHTLQIHCHPEQWLRPIG